MIDETPYRATDGSARRLIGAPNLNRLWADLLIEELVRCGVGLFCLAPGSRSAPLATAVAAHPQAKHLIHFDERGTAFAALGWARATGRPACWITTSGTAVANGFPAIVEAWTDGVPLIALTADRPPELRQAGANQAIDQPGIFAGYVRWAFDLPAPDPDVDPAFLLTTADQAYHRALHPPGPVHLNAMFREPLAPEIQTDPLPGLPGRWLHGELPFTQYAVPTGCDRASVTQLAERLDGVERGLIVAGRLRTRAEGLAATRLADHLGWPLLADVCSQLRLGEGTSNLCRYGDLVLSSEDFARHHRPGAVIYLGGRAASNRLQRFLGESGADPFVVVRDDPSRIDPDHCVTDRIQGDIETWCDALIDLTDRGDETPWTTSWRQASEAVGQAIDDRLRDGDIVTEPGVARALSRNIPSDHGLVVASSMPIRDVDSFAAGTGDGPLLVVANRGASGIDGTVATAASVARGLGQPVTVLLGDLALLHDINSLALLRDPAQPPVSIVVANNDGGGIFHFLPIAEHQESFESLFGTPHGLDFSHAAQQFGLEYQRPDSTNSFCDAYAAALSSDRSSIIEFATDRVENHALHQSLFAAAAEAVDRLQEPANV